MRKLLFILFILNALCLSAEKQNRELALLLKQLDNVINNSSEYMNQKNGRISSLKDELKVVHANKYLEFEINEMLFQEYAKYICDSAIIYINKNIEISKLLDSDDLLFRTQIDQIVQYSRTGLWVEALDVVHHIKHASFSREQSISYYYALLYLYINIADATHDQRYKDIYQNKSKLYIDSLRLYCTKDDVRLLRVNEMVNLDKGHLKAAIIDNDKRLQKVKLGSTSYALITFERSLIYAKSHDEGQHLKYLILSAMSDIRQATKDNSSLTVLSNLFYERDGELERAYRYICYAIDDANFFNGRLRGIQVSNIQSMVNKTYQKKNEKQKTNLKAMLLFISVLLIIILSAMIYIYIQMKRQTKTRQELINMNNKLNNLNEKLSVNNLQLKDTSRIKEGYITLLLSMCSQYIDKLEEYNLKISRKIATGQIEDVYKITKSAQNIEIELKNFYKEFDQGFLKLYPNFVAKFNNLLLPNEKFSLKENELNTELRIFALIRLSITDSSKIAAFLRCSVTTIYTYRTKVKNRAISRDDFEDKVQQIDSYLISN